MAQLVLRRSVPTYYDLWGNMWSLLIIETWRISVAVCLSFSGLLYRFVVGFLGFLLAGGGHGWTSAIFSGLGIFILPIFGVAMAYLNKPSGPILLAIVTIAALVVNGLLILAAWSEGFYYLQKLWDAPGGLAAWLVWLGLWLSWQVGVLAAWGVALWYRRSS